MLWFSCRRTLTHALQKIAQLQPGFEPGLTRRGLLLTTDLHVVARDRVIAVEMLRFCLRLRLSLSFPLPHLLPDFPGFRFSPLTGPLPERCRAEREREKAKESEKERKRARENGEKERQKNVPEGRKERRKEEKGRKGGREGGRKGGRACPE